MDTLEKNIAVLYPEKYQETNNKLASIISEFKKNYKIKATNKRPAFSEKDIFLICYPDHVLEKNEKTLKTLRKFLKSYAKNIISHIHILPLYPFSSDDGFSVIDYYRVHKPYGRWPDLSPLKKDFNLIFDCVLNHVSAQSDWFKKFLNGDEYYKDFFISFDKKIDVSGVFRPRTTPLLTPFKTKRGKKYVWTTFSPDQVDLNYSNPDVFLEMIKVILFYVSKGASAIRLDAIAYAWDEIRSKGFNLPEDHLLVKAFRAILEEVAPHVLLVAETVLPHNENISYLGDGGNEAHLVYNFSLEPLLLHTFLKEDTTVATNWLNNNSANTSKGTSILNLSVSHDGVHLTTARGILSGEEITALANDCKKKGGKVLYHSVNGDKEPYELNISYPSAIEGVEKYLASQAIQMALKGIPLIYFNNLVGAENWDEGVKQLDYSRAINREKFDLRSLVDALENPGTRQHKIFKGYSELLQARIKEPLFSPLADQNLIKLNNRVLAIHRYRGKQNLIALTNVSAQPVTLNAEKLKSLLDKNKAVDIITGIKFNLSSDLTIAPYQVLWLK